jgi:rod shape-determining protein MreD
MSPWRGNGIIFITVLAALAFSITPLPAGWSAARPEWPLLVLMYWSLALPHRIGVGAAWLTGLFLDILKGSLLGQHALALTLAIWALLQLYRRLRMFPLWQQAAAIGVLLLLAQAVLLLVHDMLGRGSLGWQGLLPALSGALLWPPLFLLLRALRRRYGVK